MLNRVSNKSQTLVFYTRLGWVIIGDAFFFSGSLGEHIGDVFYNDASRMHFGDTSENMRLQKSVFFDSFLHSDSQ